MRAWTGPVIVALLCAWVGWMAARAAKSERGG
jgi:hypothetical protein